MSLFKSDLFIPPSRQQDELLKNEVARLKSRLSQQERVLSGAVKRLRTTNHLKEGMEKMIIDQRKIIVFGAYPRKANEKKREITFFSPPFFPLYLVYITHGVLKKARGNLEVGLYKKKILFKRENSFLIFFFSGKLCIDKSHFFSFSFVMMIDEL